MSEDNDTSRPIDRAREWISTRVVPAIRGAAEKLRIRERLSRTLPQDLAGKLPRNLEPMAVVEILSQAIQRGGAAFYGKLLTILLSAWFLADLGALLIDRYIPEPPAVRTVVRGEGPRRVRGAEEYSAIWSRNLFNSQGLIPGEDEPNTQDRGGEPVRTSLPFNLIGTLILRDELRSLATIEDKSAAAVYPVRVDDEIPSKAKIIKVEARRVVFVNTASGRREFIDMPEDPATANSRIQIGRPGARAGGGGGVEKVADNQFNVSRAAVDKALADFNQVLTQARAVPNFENGVATGYKLFQIVPNSIYDQLGLQNGDVIMGLNGEPINDPGKAFEMLSQLKAGASNLELSVKRNGATKNYSYNIR